jgi:hypothetical protein
VTGLRAFRRGRCSIGSAQLIVRLPSGAPFCCRPRGAAATEEPWRSQ